MVLPPGWGKSKVVCAIVALNGLIREYVGEAIPSISTYRKIRYQYMHQELKDYEETIYHGLSRKFSEHVTYESFAVVKSGLTK